MTISQSNAQHMTTDLPEITVNGVPITREQLAQELQYHPAASVEEAIEKAARALIIEALLVQEANAQGLAGSVKATEGETPTEALIRTLIDYQVPPPATDEATCRRYFEQNKARFRSADLVEASHILLAADPQDPAARDAAKSQAQTLLERVQQNPQDFVALVQEYSDCPSKEVGGSLGQLSNGQTTPEFERQLFMLTEGLAPHPIESRYGYHVVRVERKITGEPLAFAQVREKIAGYLREQGNRRALSRYLHDLMDNAEVEGVDMTVINPPLSQ